MTERSLRPCKQFACTNLTRDASGYCSDHIEIYNKKIEEVKKIINRRYKFKRTDYKEQKFYTAKEWISMRDYIRIKYNGLCLYSYYVLGKIVYSDVVHHIVEIKEDWELRLDEENLIPLSTDAHRIIHKAYKNRKNKINMQNTLKELVERWGNKKISPLP